MEKQTLVEIQQLRLAYGDRVLCQDVSLHIAAGECLLLAGPNGCGKSTLLRYLAGEAFASRTSGHPRPDKREVPTKAPCAVFGRGREATVLEAKASPAKCVLIPTGIPKVKGFTVESFVRTGCFRESNWAGRLRPETEQRMEKALQSMGLWERREQDLSTLSDGEFQKACIAVGLTRNAQVLLLDEPTAYLDVENRLMVLQTLRAISQERGVAVLFSSHDLHESLTAAQRVFAFTPDGRFLESAPDTRESVLQEAFPNWQA